MFSVVVDVFALTTGQKGQSADLVLENIFSPSGLLLSHNSWLVVGAGLLAAVNNPVFGQFLDNRPTADTGPA